MNIKLFLLPLRWLTPLLVFGLGASGVFAQGTAFTYQGRLTDNGSLVNTNYDLRFGVFAAVTGGSSLALTTNSAVAVSNGLFITTLDFGAALFPGAARWLEIAVRTNAGSFAVLAPRQPFTSTPYAVRAANYSGSVAVGQLPANVARLDIAQNFAAPVTFLSATGSFVGGFSGTLAGNGVSVTNVRWTTLNGEGGLSFVPGSVFLPGSSPTVGTSPRALASADVNNDTRTDLIAANSGNGTLTVLTNDGLGGFATASSPAVGTDPRSVAAVDVNADGRPDLISANYSSGTLSVLTNNGGGAFVPASTNTVGASPSSVAVADVNADGKPDLISANLGPSTLTILTNKGAGTFALASSPTVGSSPIFVAAADVNGDGRPDLAVGLNSLLFLAGRGDGTFKLGTPFGAWGNTAFWTVANFSGDGGMGFAGTSFASSGANAGQAGKIVVLPKPLWPSLDSFSVIAAGLGLGPVASGSIATAFGSAMAGQVGVAPSSGPIPSLASTSVIVTDVAGKSLPANLYYVSPGQVNYVIPAASATGAATVTIRSSGAAGARLPIQIARVAPGLFTLNVANLAAAYVTRVDLNGEQTIQPVYRSDESGNLVASAIDVRPAGATFYLTVFGTGIRNGSANGVTASVGLVYGLPVTYAGSQGSNEGLDQVNIRLPSGPGSPLTLSGPYTASVQLTVDGQPSNRVIVMIQ